MNSTLNINITIVKENTVSEENASKKRGRKPSKERKGYFYEEQEQAVVDYLSTDDVNEKNRIFNSILKPAFTKMIEAIIRRYSLYPPDEEFKETFDDTISFLMTKLSCFNPKSNYKAYSYCGTICKNYLIYKINQFSKNQKRSESYDNTMSNLQRDITNNITYSYSDEDPQSTFMNELTGSTVNEIQKIVNEKSKVDPNCNEVRVGKALIELLMNWDELFAQMGSNKFNKSSILMFLKETTRLSTTEIRNAIRVYKKRYYVLKEDIIND